MILDEILASKRLEIAGLRGGYESWSPPATAPARRDFAAAISPRRAGLQPARLSALQQRRGGVALIAEFKRRSPSRGDINSGADPAGVARVYQAAGAAAMSVLTDRRYFGGSLDDLVAARRANDLPTLRKDFIIEPCQVAESCGPDGPDCLLLIAAALDVSALRALRELAARCGQVCLVEVHDEAELDTALESGAEIIGINNRDLKTFEVSLETTMRLRPRVPAGPLVVSESGIHTADDVRRLAAAGVDAMLVGEALMSAADPSAKIGELLGR